MQAHLTACHRKRCRQVRDEPVHDWINGAPQDGIYRTAHARVAQESCAAGKNLFVRSLNVGVSSNDGRNFSVEKPAQCDFFTGSLSVYVHDDVRRLVAHLCHRCIDRVKRIFQNRLHKCARLHVDDTDFPLGCFQDDRPVPRCAIRIIHRAQQTRFGVDERKNFFLVPYVVACGDD
jgi:hypothetical protein